MFTCVRLRLCNHKRVHVCMVSCTYCIQPVGMLCTVSLSTAASAMVCAHVQLCLPGGAVLTGCVRSQQYCKNVSSSLHRIVSLEYVCVTHTCPSVPHCSVQPSRASVPYTLCIPITTQLVLRERQPWHCLLPLLCVNVYCWRSHLVMFATFPHAFSNQLLSLQITQERFGFQVGSMWWCESTTCGTGGNTPSFKEEVSVIHCTCSCPPEVSKDQTSCYIITFGLPCLGSNAECCVYCGHFVCINVYTVHWIPWWGNIHI